MRVLLLLSAVALGAASCPNDCSGHGTCNIYSACECYRNWMAADCSERVCYFGHAFIDTPQGDLNADGRVDNINNVHKVVIGSNQSFWSNGASAVGGNVGTSASGDNIVQSLGRGKQVVRAEHGVGVTAGAARTYFWTANRDGTTFKNSGTRNEAIVESNVDMEYTTDTTILPTLASNQSSDIYGYAEACATLTGQNVKYAIEVIVTDTFETSAATTREKNDTDFQAMDAISGLTMHPADAGGTEDLDGGTSKKFVGYTQTLTFTADVAVVAGQYYQQGTGATAVTGRAITSGTASSHDFVIVSIAVDGAAVSSGNKFVGTAAINKLGARTAVAPTVASTSACSNAADCLTGNCDSGTDTCAAAIALTNAGTNTSGTPRWELTGGATSTSDDRILYVCSVENATYSVQWANNKQWEGYPKDHGKAKNAATSKSTFDEAHFYRECSNKGACNRQSGLCECFAGYVGEGCSRTACPNDCSGHGTCSRAVDNDPNFMAWDAYKTQSCTCDAGYGGTDCSQRECPFGDDPVSRINDMNEIQVFGYAEHGTLTDGGASTSGAGVTELKQSEVVANAHPAAAAAIYDITFPTGVCTGTATACSNTVSCGGFCNDSNGEVTPTAACSQHSDCNATEWCVAPKCKSALNYFEAGDEVYNDAGKYVCTAAAVSQESITCKDASVAAITASTKLRYMPDNGVLCNNYNVASSGPVNAANNSAVSSAETVNKNPGVATHAFFTLEFQDEFGDKWSTKSINFMSSTVAADVEAALEALPNDAIQDVEVSLIDGNVLNTSADVFGETTRGRYVAVTFLHNSGDQPMLGARYKFTYSEPDLESDAICTAATLKQTENTSGGQFDNTGPFKIKEKVKGNKENANCSNRGICDYASGLCKCFAGFTDYDCSIQNALASS